MRVVLCPLYFAADHRGVGVGEQPCLFNLDSLVAPKWTAFLATQESMQVSKDIPRNNIMGNSCPGHREHFTPIVLVLSQRISLRGEILFDRKESLFRHRGHSQGSPSTI